MTKAMQRKIAKAYKAREAATDAVYAAAYPRRDIPFSQCLKLASAEVVQAYRDADAAHYRAEREAIDAGKAWMSGGLLFFYKGGFQFQFQG